MRDKTDRETCGQKQRYKMKETETVIDRETHIKPNARLKILCIKNYSRNVKNCLID